MEIIYTFAYLTDTPKIFSTFRSHQQNLKLQWKRLMESKRIYETRCREEVACNQFYHQEISRLGKSSKEAEKVYQNIENFCETMMLL